jgi:hypothetical protein
MPPAITKSDEEFAELGMEFVWGADEIDLAALNVLFAAVRHACVASGTPEKMPQHGSVPEAVWQQHSWGLYGGYRLSRDA